MHGSLVIAALASDGAVMAADSRVAISDLNGTIMGYFDGLPKIQLLCGKYPVAAVGQTMIDQRFVHTLIADFDSQANPDEQPEVLFRMLKDYMGSLQPHFTNTSFAAGKEYAKRLYSIYVFW